MSDSDCAWRVNQVKRTSKHLGRVTICCVRRKWVCANGYKGCAQERANRAPTRPKGILRRTASSSHVEPSPLSTGAGIYSKSLNGLRSARYTPFHAAEC